MSFVRSRQMIAVMALIFLSISFIVTYRLIDSSLVNDDLSSLPEKLDPETKEETYDRDLQSDYLQEPVKFDVEQQVRAHLLEDLESTWEGHEKYIGIFGDHIAIFHGKPGVGGTLHEETDICIEKIPDFEIRNLRRGIAFSTEEEKYSILEGLHFPH